MMHVLSIRIKLNHFIFRHTNNMVLLLNILNGLSFTFTETSQWEKKNNFRKTLYVFIMFISTIVKNIVIHVISKEYNTVPDSFATT